jgi:hypothetical protein
MKHRLAQIMALCACLLLSQTTFGEDLKAYFEKQKTEIAPTFQPPELGNEITLSLAAGQQRSGILIKLTDSAVSLMTDSGLMVYKRSNLHDSTRALLFAEDYAHAKAIEKTREYKQQRHIENIKEQQAGTHDGRISVASKLDKKSDKTIDEDKRENPNTGDTTTKETTTRTKTAIQKLSVTIANNTTHPDTYTLEWYILAESVSGGEPSTFDDGSETITVGAGKRVRHEIESESMVATEVTVERISSAGSSGQDPQVTARGNEPAGYVVLLKYGNTILDKKASSKSFLTDEWLNKIQN